MHYKYLQEITNAVKSIPEVNMRRNALAQKLNGLGPLKAFWAIQALIRSGGQSNLDISRSLAALVSCLEPPSAIDYKQRVQLVSRSQYT